jgi:hypothetical protein
MPVYFFCKFTFLICAAYSTTGTNIFTVTFLVYIIQKNCFISQMFIWFEDLKNDLPDVVRRVAEFLGKSQLVEDPANMEALLFHLDFKNFRENKSVNKSEEVMPDMKKEEKKNPFIRKGVVGDWKNYFDQETNRDWDHWIEETLKDTGMVMKFEL